MNNDRIFILGVGSLGQLVAHALRKEHPGLRITFILHRSELASQWYTSGKAIRCVTNGKIDHSGDFDIELIPSPATRQVVFTPPKSPIKFLLVATKTYATSEALSSLKYRLGSSSTICFMQNGMGVIEEVTSSVFIDAKSRPSYWAAVCSRSVYRTSLFSIAHSGSGGIEFGAVSLAPQNLLNPDSTPSPPPDLMIQLLLATPALQPVLMTPDHIKIAQLRKLVVNASINPLTAIFRCKLGELLDNPLRFRLMRALFKEAQAIALKIISETLPDLASALQEEIVWLSVKTVAENGRANQSSMLQDVMAGRQTEIDYINGYLISQARRLGVCCNNHIIVTGMVKSLRVFEDDEVLSTFAVREDFANIDPVDSSWMGAAIFKNYIA